MMSKGEENWNMGMFAAAKCDQKNLVELFIEKGADNWNGEWLLQQKAVISIWLISSF